MLQQQVSIKEKFHLFINKQKIFLIRASFLKKNFNLNCKRISVATLLVMVASCGGDSSDTTTAGPAANPPPSATPTPNPPPIRPSEPPTPAPSTTLAGVDANRDGVRDDVQQFIERKYIGEQPVQMALLQVAGALQLSTTAQTQQQVQAALKAREDATLCVADRTSLLRARTLLSEIKEQQFSTEERAMAEIKFNQAISGQVKTFTPSSAGGTCK